MRLALLTIAALWLTAAERPATAQTGGALSAPTTAKAAAQELLDRGVQLFTAAEQTRDATRYEAAYLQFKQAMAIYQSDTLVWNLALAEVRTGRYADGLRHLRAYNKAAHVTTTPHHPDLARFSAVFDEASKATGHLVIVDVPAGVHVQVDGVDVGAAPFEDPVDVASGPHTVAASLAGGRVLTARVSPAAGEGVRVSLADRTLDIPTPPAVEGHGGIGTQRVLALVSGGVGLAGIVVGTFLGIDAKSKGDSASSVCPGSQCPTQQGIDMWSDAHSAAKTANVALAIGAVGLVGGAVLWLTVHPDTPKAQVGVGVAFGSVLVRGAW
jgi:hypothetical protein